MRFLLLCLSTALTVLPVAAAVDSAALSLPTRCTIVVKSIPDSAAVVFADSIYGITPCTIELPAGDLKISLKKKGCYLKTAALSMAAGEMREVLFELAMPARLLVVTDPVAATVRIDGKDAGLSPIMLEKLKPGDHDLVLTHEGCISATRSVTLKSGAADTLFLSLSPVPAAVSPPPTLIAAASDSAKSAAQNPVVDAKALEKKRSGIVDKVAIGAFAVFSLIILGVELAQNR